MPQAERSANVYVWALSDADKYPEKDRTTKQPTGRMIDPRQDGYAYRIQVGDSDSTAYNRARLSLSEAQLAALTAVLTDPHSEYRQRPEALREKRAADLARQADELAAARRELEELRAKLGATIPPGAGSARTKAQVATAREVAK